MADAPIVKVSAVTGAGIPELKEAIARLATQAPPRQQSGAARLPVDRVFSISGFGTVVTGTLWSGAIRVGDEVEVQPQGIKVKVRGLQVHGVTVKEALAGQRVAVNLAGIEVQDIDRGSTVVAPGAFAPTLRLDASLRVLPEVKAIKNRSRVHFYLGTAEVLARVVLLDREELPGGEEGPVQLLLEAPVVAGSGDRFVIRSFSPLETIGGGAILAAHPLRHRRFRAEVIADLKHRAAGQAKEIVAGVLRENRTALAEAEVAYKAELEPAAVQRLLAELAAAGQAVLFKEEGLTYALDAGRYQQWAARVVSALEEHHRKFPLRKGLSKEELRTRAFPRQGVKPFQGFLKHGAAAGSWRLEGNDVFLPQFEVRLAPKIEQAYQAVAQAFRQGWFAPPTWAEAIAPHNLSPKEAEELLHYAQRQGALVRLAEGLYMDAEAVKAAREEVRRLGAGGEVALAEVRDALGSSRKFVLPLLEHFDQVKFTRRVGDKRVVIG